MRQGLEEGQDRKEEVMSEASKTPVPEDEVQEVVAEAGLFRIARELRLIRLELEQIRKQMPSRNYGGPL